MACYPINISPRDSSDGRIVEKMWTGNDVDLFGLKNFGYLAYVYAPSDEKSKPDLK